MEKDKNKRKREQESSPGALEEPADKRSCNNERSSSPQPSTSGSQVIPVQPERSSNPQPSTSGSQVIPVQPERSSSPQPSTSGSQVIPVQPERSSSRQPSTSGSQRGGLQALVQQRARERRRRSRRRELQARCRRLREGYFDVEVVFSGPRPSVRMPPWVPPATVQEVMAEVLAWWNDSPLSPEILHPLLQLPHQPYFGHSSVPPRPVSVKERWIQILVDESSTGNGTV
ncbi:uncharacterized protein LOC122867734 isoform X2 [Siniperca chuatsi]|uniref:uncharacterized protein LOC122867734 isoform X2 n=1 Tax=Siniperca chuatsi TaxID=119488 RepID=UPI001CE0B2D6|nr:uncharacterized protein LOC122867734 isoform X2 [Siniperca chuatsi]